jgi:hypothetical protein
LIVIGACRRLSATRITTGDDLSSSRALKRLD